MKKIFSYKNLFIYSILFLIFTLLIISNSFSYINSSISDKLYGNQKNLDNILIIEIDDSSINQIGRWPWDRDVFSNLLNKLNFAKVIGIDVSFFEISDNDGSLEETLNSMDHIVLASEINNGLLFNPVFNSSYGYVNLITDPDGVTRSFQGRLNETLPFSFEIFKKYSPNNLQVFSDKTYLINFASPPGSFNSISFYDALNQDIQVENKIILIGATAPNLHDNYFVPTSKGIAMSGVEIHANIIQNIILDNFLEKQKILSILVLVFIFSIIGFFFLSRLKIYYLIPAVLLIILFYLLIGIYSFNHNYLLNLFYVPLSILIFTGAGIATNYLEEKKHSAYLTEAFGRYISKDLLKEIISKKHQLKLGGTKRELSVFFSDIRGFTTLSENLPAEKLVLLLNEYLTEMTKVIMNNKGTVDKFIGDAIMAFWNAPLLEKEHAKFACLSAISQVQKLGELKKSWKKRNLPEINIGCGIHTGEAIIGNMGSEDRFDYTAIGDVVNLSSRLEGLTKQYQVPIIISESTYKLVKSFFLCRKLDRVKVKGKKIPISIYELIVEKEKSSLNFIKQFENALNLYFNSRFKQAKKEFELALKINSKDSSSKMFIERCNQYIKTPPKNSWDGSFEMKTK